MRRKYKIVFVAFAFLVIIAILSSAYKARRPARPDFLDPAKTAAFSNVIAIAKQVQGNPDLSGSVGGAKQQPNIEAQRADFVMRNRDSFASLERALREPIEAPEGAYDGKVWPKNDQWAVKVAAKGFVTKGADAEARGQIKEAADAYVNALRIGVAYENGPFIYFLVGSAIERVGLGPLQMMLPKLTPDELCAVAKEIQTINHERPSFAEITRREEYFGIRNSSNVVQFVSARLSTGARGVVAKSLGVHLDLQTQLEGISAAAATLAYHRENQPPLTNLQSLVPKYLKAIPVDPHTGAPFRIFPTNGGVIYSVGANKRDDSARGDDITFYFGK
jgi:hypothetical protein